MARKALLLHKLCIKYILIRFHPRLSVAFYDFINKNKVIPFMDHLTILVGDGNHLGMWCILENLKRINFNVDGFVKSVNRAADLRG
jgi:hypothetical protein